MRTDFPFNPKSIVIIFIFLLSFLTCVSQAENTHIKVDKDNKMITVSCGGDNILSYYYALHDVPEGVDPAYRRSGFIHPLYSPSGHILTRIQPPDHYHHYGIWAPWTKTHIDGKEVDFWNLAKKQGTVRFAELLATKSGTEGGFKVLQEHVQFLDEGSERVAITEELQVQASVQKLNKQRFWLIDIQSEFINKLSTDIILDQYRYGGGIGFRATEQWVKGNCSVLTSEGKTREDADGTRARWCDVNGQTGDNGQRSGILFLSHPDNREHPEPMRVWPENIHQGQLFFEFCPIRLNSWVLEPEKKYTLRYRMVVYDGKLEKAMMEKFWEQYSEKL